MDQPLNKPTREQIRSVLEANAGGWLRIVFCDGFTEAVQIDCPDEEGFLHSAPGGGDPQAFWTRFEDVISATPIAPDQTAAPAVS